MPTNRTLNKIETLTRDFGVADAKGRAIGGAFYIGSAVYTPRPEGPSGGWVHELGTFITGRPQATRDGKSYGASQRSQEYPSVEAAREAAEEYFTKAAKRAARS